MDSTRIAQFDALRGILAVWVLITSAVTVAGYDAFDLPRPLQFLLLGNAPVEVFMILSGFVIFYLLDQKQEGYALYITRRFLRLYPVYLLFLLVAYYQADDVLNFLRQIPWSSYSIRTFESIKQGANQYRDAHFIAHLTMLHGLIPSRWLPNADIGLLRSAWSVTVEWQFYLVAPLLFMLIRLRAGFVFLIVALLTLEMIDVNRVAFVGVQAKFFAAGVISYFVWKHREDWINPTWARSRMLFLGVVAAIYVFTYSVPLALWGAMLFLILNPKPVQREFVLLQAILSNRILRHVGAISFSVYLSHIFVINNVGMTMLRYEWTEQWQFALVLTTTSLVFCLMLSHVLYRFVEQPFIKLGRNLGAGRVSTIDSEPSPRL